MQIIYTRCKQALSDTFACMYLHLQNFFLIFKFILKLVIIFRCCLLHLYIFSAGKFFLLYYSAHIICWTRINVPFASVAESTRSLYKNLESPSRLINSSGHYCPEPLFQVNCSGNLL